MTDHREKLARMQCFVDPSCTVDHGTEATAARAHGVVRYAVKAYQASGPLIVNVGDTLLLLTSSVESQWGQCWSEEDQTFGQKSGRVPLDHLTDDLAVLYSQLFAEAASTTGAAAAPATPQKTWLPVSPPHPSILECLELADSARATETPVLVEFVPGKAWVNLSEADVVEHLRETRRQMEYAWRRADPSALEKLVQALDPRVLDDAPPLVRKDGCAEIALVSLFQHSARSPVDPCQRMRWNHLPLPLGWMLTAADNIGEALKVYGKIALYGSSSNKNEARQLATVVGLYRVIHMGMTVDEAMAPFASSNPC